MKRLLLLICFFIGSLWITSAQEKDAYNFSTKDGDVIWQKVYPTNLSTKEVFDAIKTSGNLFDITETDQVMTGNLVERVAEYSSLGYKRGTVPIFVNHLLGGFAEVEMRDGRYRVTISKMYRIDDTSPSRDRTDFTFYVNRKGYFVCFPKLLVLSSTQTSIRCLR